MRTCKIEGCDNTDFYMTCGHRLCKEHFRKARRDGYISKKMPKEENEKKKAKTLYLRRARMKRFSLDNVA